VKGSILRRHDVLGLAPGTVILTFDDGPVGEGRTEALLDLLGSHGIRAAFCVIGRLVERFPEVCRRIHAQGHLLVNHSYRHIHPMALSEADLLADIAQCDAVIGEALGIADYRSAWFRPPGGFWNQRLEQAVFRTGKAVYPVTHFAWDILALPGNQWRIAAMIRSDLKRHRAGIYVLHESIYPLTGEANPRTQSCPWMPPVVEEIIAEAERQGAKFVDPDFSPGFRD